MEPEVFDIIQQHNKEQFDELIKMLDSRHIIIDYSVNGMVYVDLTPIGRHELKFLKNCSSVKITLEYDHDEYILRFYINDGNALDNLKKWISTYQPKYIKSNC